MLHSASRFEIVSGGPSLDDVRQLFVEYGQSLNFNLCFQSFDEELKGLPGEYAAPNGRLLLCRWEDRPAGCVALRQLDPATCEMKRLFVRPEFRGHRLGELLVNRVLAEARDAGYQRIRLDTIRGAMDQAIALYRALGFQEIPPYTTNPIASAIFMELQLQSVASSKKGSLRSKRR